MPIICPICPNLSQCGPFYHKLSQSLPASPKVPESLRMCSYVYQQCFFFLGVKLKSGRESHLAPNSRFLHGQKSFFTPTFLGFFKATFLFSRPLLRFFLRVKNMVLRPNFQEFSAFFWLLTGRILYFFNAHYFSFHRRNFRKFSRAKINFHGYFLGLFQFFFTGTFFFHAQNSKILHGWLFFFTPKKKKHWYQSIPICLNVSQSVPMCLNLSQSYLIQSVPSGNFGTDGESFEQIGITLYTFRIDWEASGNFMIVWADIGTEWG